MQLFQAIVFKALKKVFGKGSTIAKVPERKNSSIYFFLLLPLEKHAQKGMYSPQNLALRTGISSSG